MCNPLILAPLMAGASVGGAGLAAGGVSALTAGQIAFAALSGAAAGASSGAAYEAAEYNEELAKQEKVMLDADAMNTRIAGSQESQQALSESQKTAARNRVEIAASGLDVNTGTAALINEEVARFGALEQMTILSNADRQALNLEYKGAAGVDAAKAAKKQAKIGIGTSLLTSAAGGYFGAAKAPAPVDTSLIGIV